MATFPATIYTRVASSDKICILNTRAQMFYPFEAPGWQDLRIGFFLSLTRTADPDLITTLTESITGPYPATDAYWIGVKTRDFLQPYTAGTVFAGFTNAIRATASDGNSNLISSDLGIGNDSNYWRAQNSVITTHQGKITDGTQTMGSFVDGAQHHYAQANIGTTGPAGYATLISIRMTRDQPQSKAITFQTKSDTTLHTGDVLFTNTPTKVLLRTNLQNFPTTVQQIGPVTLSQVPDALYCYWPFSLSRLRISCVEVLQVR